MRMSHGGVSGSVGAPVPMVKTPRRAVIVSALGLTQVFAWGASYYLPAVLAAPIVADTGWPLPWVVGGLSLGLLTAGLVSPWVGRAIALRGGRPVLAASACLLAVGLLALALAHSLPAFLAAWIVIGLGMGSGLYDPAFATLGRLYGAGGRSAITTLTLFGGFASTVCWPLSAFLEARLGWRGACLAYAGFHLAVALPVYLFLLPREARRLASTPTMTGSPMLGATPNGNAGQGRVSAPRHDDYAGLGDFDGHVGASADNLANEGLHPGRSREPWRARWTLSGCGSRDRNGDCAISSSHLDENGGDLTGGGRFGRLRDWRLGRPFCARSLWRRDRPRKHCQRDAAACDLRS